MAQWIAHIHRQGVFAVLVANMGKLLGDGVQRLVPANTLEAGRAVFGEAFLNRVAQAIRVAS